MAPRGAEPLADLAADARHRLLQGLQRRGGTSGRRRLLRQVAQTPRDSLHRAGDLVARYGGEEFVILLPETDSEHACVIAESLRERIEQLGIEHIASPMGRVTVNIGVASIAPPRDGTGAGEFMHAADAALYDAKRQGRNRVVG